MEKLNLKELKQTLYELGVIENKKNSYTKEELLDYYYSYVEDELLRKGL